MNSFLRHTAASTCRRRLSLPSALIAARRLHTLQLPPYPVDDGLPPFLSPKALKIIAVDWQQGLLNELNNLVESSADGDYKNKSVHQIVLDSAAKREDIAIFNYASQALNNSFFLNNLSPAEQGRRTPVPKFMAAISEHFGGLPHLQSTMSAAAEGMVGSGWVWLVVDGGGRLAVVATYGAGTMLVGSRRQSDPFLSENKDKRAAPDSGGEHQESAFLTNILIDSQKNFQHWGAVLNPIFCISVHEHAWLTDYGVWGKVEYLKRFWSVLNWTTVSSHWGAWQAK